MNELVCASSLLFLAVFARGETCTTPDGSPGNCVELYGCPVLADLVRNRQRTPEDVLLLRKSTCGLFVRGNIPKVCCPRSCLALNGEQGTCVANSSCPHVTNISKEKRCLGSDLICCPSPKPEFGYCTRRLTAFPFLSSSQCCGTDGQTEIKGFFYGIELVYIDQYPWMALLEYQIEKNKTRPMCGGSLISGKYVLTAAHCITGPVLKHGTLTGVRLGEYDTTKDVDCSEDRASSVSDCALANDTITIPVESTIYHPLYDPSTGKHDIGLIRLKDLAPYTDFIRPICLPTKDYTLEKPQFFNLQISGWGIRASSQKSLVKEHALLSYIEREDCQKLFNSWGINITLGDDQICAGGEIGKSPCKGDSGGTLMHLHIAYEAVGVMSFGPIICELEIPTVYTNVFKYIDWIYSAIKP